jgi:hypothetical protein
MRVLGDAEVLALWERGAARHPLDRALLLCGRVRDDVPPDELADLPLGVVNAALLRLRRACFGRRIAARATCPRCRGELELVLDADRLADVAAEPGADREASVDGFRFRLPTARDLAAVADGADAQATALRLLERCCVERPAEAARPLEPLLEEAERQLEALDPGADLELAVTCEACGHAWHASLDAGALVWQEIAARAATVLADVHRLALAYGWSEREILALSPQRRAMYLELGAA